MAALILSAPTYNDKKTKEKKIFKKIEKISNELIEKIKISKGKIKK